MSLILKSCNLFNLRILSRQNEFWEINDILNMFYGGYVRYTFNSEVN